MESRKIYLRRSSPKISKRLNFENSKLFVLHLHASPSLPLLFSMPKDWASIFHMLELRRFSSTARNREKGYSSRVEVAVKINSWSRFKKANILLREKRYTTRRKIQDWSRWIPVEIENMCGSKIFGSKIIDSGEFQSVQRYKDSILSFVLFLDYMHVFIPELR